VGFEFAPLALHAKPEPCIKIRARGEGKIWIRFRKTTATFGASPRSWKEGSWEDLGDETAQLQMRKVGSEIAGKLINVELPSEDRGRVGLQQSSTRRS